MPIGADYYNDGLDALVNSWPSSGARWALFDADPVTPDPDTGVPLGVELSGGGYTSPSFAHANFSAASGNSKTVASPISFGTSTAAYDNVGTHWAILNSSDAVVYWDDLPDAEVIAVSASGSAVTISPTLSFGN